MDNINEGTMATIIVKTGSKYAVSFVQYDGDPQSTGQSLVDYFNTAKDAKKLVSKSGEISGIEKNRIDFYTDRTLLRTGLSRSEALEEGNDFGSYIYYWNGQIWKAYSSGINNFNGKGIPLTPTKVAELGSIKKFTQFMEDSYGI